MKPLALLLAFLAILPVASADHVFSHRYFVDGRVVDANGAPVAGLNVTASLTGHRYGACDRTLSTTNATGDFSICFHVHVVRENGVGSVTIRGQEQPIALNASARRTVVRIQLAEPVPGASVDLSEFRSTYRVAGRIFNLTGPRDVEGVFVDNDAAVGRHVTVAVAYNGEKSLRQGTLTNGFGDFILDLSLGEPLSTGTLTVASGAQAVQLPMNRTFMRSDVNLVVDPRFVAGPPVNLTPFNASDLPGSSATPGFGAVSILAVALTAFIFSRRR